MLGTFSLFLILVIPGSGQAPTPGEPITRVFTDYELPPPDLETAWKKVAIVALVRIRQSQAQGLRDSR